MPPLAPRPARAVDPRRRGRTPAWAPLTLRVVAVIVLVGIAPGGHRFDRDGPRDDVDRRISPASLAGLQLAGSTQGQHIADHLADPATCEGEMRLEERVATATEVGWPLFETLPGRGLRVLGTAGAHGFWRDEARSLETGDVVPSKAALGR